MRARAGRQVSKVASLPAPTGGLNAKDAIADMPETDAVLLDNWFCSPSAVNVRNGSTNHTTGFPGWVETLMGYTSGISKQLFAISGGNIYNSTNIGAAPSASVTGLTNSRFQYTNIGTPGGRFLVAVNGADKRRLYDGTTWTADGDGTHDITGVDSRTLVHCNLFQNRLWFCQNGTLVMWYLGLQAISGAATSFDFSTVFRLGGYIMAMASWTIDNVAGINDYAVFITSEGEYAVYQGNDPTNATTFSLVGVFRAGRPIGRRCFIKVGSDVIVISADGAFPLSKALLTDRSQIQDAISNKIVNLVNNDVQEYNGNFGWQPCLYPIGNKFIINVPMVENNTQYQYVMNTITGAWSRFTGWNAACFEQFNDLLYYGGNGVVVQCDVGGDDNGSQILADVQQAFSHFKTSGQKKFNMARPVFLTSGNLTAALAMCLDYGTRVPTSTPTYSANPAATWNVATWNVTPWTFGNNILRKWQTITGVGFAGSLRMQVASLDQYVSWQATDFAFEQGGVL